MRIPAGRSELRKISEKHYLVGSEGSSPSHCLLLFYAAECGLKSLYIKKNRLDTTEEITDGRLHDSHDLAAWVKALNLPAYATGGSPSFKLRRDGRFGQNWPLSLAHQAWRYGIHMEDEDERSLTTWLKLLNEKLKEISR